VLEASINTLSGKFKGQKNGIGFNGGEIRFSVHAKHNFSPAILHLGKLFIVGMKWMLKYWMFNGK